MLVLGIDPGTLHLGWGLIACEGARLRHVAHGVLHTKASGSLSDRLIQIDDGLGEVLDTYRPAEAGVEAIFFAHDATAAAKLGHARGVVLLLLARRKIVLAEYPPARVKRAVGANGRAEKSQVARMVQAMLRLTELPPADAADALAVAITHVQMAPARKMAELAALQRAARPIVAAGRGPLARPKALAFVK